MSFVPQLLDEEIASDPEAIDALELNMHIPAGQWRKGDTHPNSDGILLRFCPRMLKSREDGPKRLPQPVFGQYFSFYYLVCVDFFNYN